MDLLSPTGVRFYFANTNSNTSFSVNVLEQPARGQPDIKNVSANGMKQTA